MDNGEIDLWSTHLPLLAGCVANTSGPILELGSGHYSTRVLHALCRGRHVTTVDTNRKYVSMLEPLANADHEIILVDDIAAWVQNAKRAERYLRYAFVFEDSGRAQLRPDNIAAVRDICEFIVVNNTEPGLKGEPFRPVYRYETIIPTFEHRFDYKAYPVWTSVVSDSPLPEWLKDIV